MATDKTAYTLLEEEELPLPQTSFAPASAPNVFLGSPEGLPLPKPAAAFGPGVPGAFGMSNQASSPHSPPAYGFHDNICGKQVLAWFSPLTSK